MKKLMTSIATLVALSAAPLPAWEINFVAFKDWSDTPTGITFDMPCNSYTAVEVTTLGVGELIIDNPDWLNPNSPDYQFGQELIRTCFGSICPPKHLVFTVTASEGVMLNQRGGTAQYQTQVSFAELDDYPWGYKEENKTIKAAGPANSITVKRWDNMQAGQIIGVSAIGDTGVCSGVSGGAAGEAMASVKLTVSNVQEMDTAPDP